MGMASDSRKHQGTTFTSIGSQESLDQLGHDCGHGWSPEPSIFCSQCSCNLCLDCYPSHNRHFHGGVTPATRHDSLQHDHTTLKSVSPHDLTNEKTSRKHTQLVLNVSSSFETDLRTENWQFHHELYDVNELEHECYQIAEENTESQKEESNDTVSEKEMVLCKAENKVSKQNMLPFNLKRTIANHVITVDCDPAPKQTRITGMVLMKNMLIVADFYNKCVKVIETYNYKTISELEFSTGPWDMTEVNKSQIAVTLTDKQKIAFLRLKEGQLSQEREISTSGYCDGVACHDNMLVVTFVNPANLQLLDLHGNHLPGFTKPPDLIFQEPRHVAISQDGQKLYVSDFQRNEVLCMTVCGQLLCKYSSPELQGPEKLTVCDDDSVFVCGGSSNNLHLITAQCECLSVLLTEKDGLKYPQSMTCCLATKKLYIGFDGDIGIKIYELQENKRKKKKRKTTKAK